jgi:predicted TIM-barrel fold metal-dependent hydrolase
LQRRKILKIGLAIGATTALAGTIIWNQVFDGPIANPCLIDGLPTALAEHPLMQQAFAGLDVSQLWDSHFHLLGNGLNNGFDGQTTGIWLNPKMSSWLSPIQKLQYGFYLDAACISEADKADSLFLENINKTMSQLPEGIRFMLLAFDYQYDNHGNAKPKASTFYIPNEYAARVAKAHQSFEWIASVHPYRADAIEQLEWCKANGAKAVKWLPPAMNINPSAGRCDGYYQKLVELKLPLLTHAGDEKAVHSEELQKLANPLLLRRALDQGVKVIVAHCASLGSNQDLDNKQASQKSNFELFARLMNDANYQNNCLADISAINLINRDLHEIKQLVENQDWHSRLLYASDYPLPGVMPIISSKNLAANGLLDESVVPFINQVRQHNAWLYDFLVKRLMKSNGIVFSNDVFQTRKHFG